jgi:hypothetical protein
MRSVERKPLRFSGAGPSAESGSVTKIAAGARSTRPRGRLNRAVLAMLGKGLEECFDEVRKQEVPERFKLLLQQF